MTSFFGSMLIVGHPPFLATMFAGSHVNIGGPRDDDVIQAFLPVRRDRDNTDLDRCRARDAFCAEEEGKVIPELRAEQECPARHEWNPANPKRFDNNP
ncbi:uncharacterized protein N7496_003540 [Penicillium cataractarum]|uniref:Uncharacterized protein n=1 Tax=Penicillium cataractarum TaxID=2100454 RepID=A0A9W9SMA4_9EURO|nr:uncharacterized protein N7496_003540 [Penicillium cataractarum]KAJ5381112.1 hypothetical protein N7496_003540 [Penicillium cataractarum]